MGLKLVKNTTRPKSYLPHTKKDLTPHPHPHTPTPTHTSPRHRAQVWSGIRRSMISRVERIKNPPFPSIENCFYEIYLCGNCREIMPTWLTWCRFSSSLLLLRSSSPPLSSSSSSSMSAGLCGRLFFFKKIIIIYGKSMVIFYFVVEPPHGRLPLRVPPPDSLQGLGPGQAGVLRQGTEIFFFKKIIG